MNKKILFFTQACFLDAALEYIRLLSNSNYDVHVCIELAPSQLKVNLFNIDADLNLYNNKTSYWDVAKEWKLEFLSAYFKECKSVDFFVYKATGSIGNVLSVTNSIRNHIREIKPDFIHFDDFSARLAFLMPVVCRLRKKVVLNIHDPKPHVGEKEWKRYYAKKILFKAVKTFITYSKYSAAELKSLLPAGKQVDSLQFLPFSVYQSFGTDHKKQGETTVSFVGRISPYKGVNLLIDAIPKVLKSCPQVKFIIAGKPIPGFKAEYPEELLQGQLQVVEKHLSNDEMASIINASHLVVCPYIEATQSGVIMTSHALDCPVLVTNVGGLAEYIVDGKTGLITMDVTSDAIADQIIRFVQLNKYAEMKYNLESNDYVVAAENYNRGIMKQIYN